jgi:large subunit ribosomal protein L15
VTPELLAEKGLVKGRYDVLKVLGDGEVTKGLKVSAHRFSKSAQAKIEAAGGSVTIIPGPTPVEEKKKNARLSG